MDDSLPYRDEENFTQSVVSNINLSETNSK